MATNNSDKSKAILMGAASSVGMFLVYRPFAVSKSVYVNNENLKEKGELQNDFPNSYFDTLMALIKDNKLYRGGLFSIFTKALTTAITYNVKNKTKDLLISDVAITESPMVRKLKKKLNLLLTAGVTLSLTLPFQTIDFKYQCDINETYDLSQNWQDDIKLSYSTFGVSVIGLWLYGMIYDTCYEIGKQRLLNNDNLNQNKLIYLSLGAAIIAGCVTYPFDIIRQRMIIAEETTNDAYLNLKKRALNNKQGLLNVFYKGFSLTLVVGIIGATAGILNNKYNLKKNKQS